MQRHTQTQLFRLMVGDQFECFNSEIIFTVLETPRLIKGVRYVRKGPLKMTDMLPAQTEVIFLKHKNLKK